MLKKIVEIENMKYCGYNISSEMINHYYRRTNFHIDLVRKYCFKIYDQDKNNQILKRADIHDLSKFKEPELIPYIFITWNYYCKDNNVEFEISDELKEKMNEATEQHILNNPHHPEFHQSRTDNLLNKDDRDGNIIPDQIIDATKMNILDMSEMVADWCAMSEERENTPFEWAEKVINKRWKFTNNQVDFIMNLINKIWE